MLSPGKYHLRVPRERVSNLKFRLFVLRRAKNNRPLQLALLEACRKDILFFINVFCFQFNPNSIGTVSTEIGPFITWVCQDEAFREMIDCVEQRRDLLIEKSREMGASWMCLILFVWFLLFFKNKDFLVISRDEKSVDNRGNMKSLFPKIDFILERLPDWMAGKRIMRKKLFFRNKDNNSSITGEASTGDSGVGGRAWAMFIDEFSAIKEDHYVRQRTSDTSGCRIFNGTHRGMETAFYELSQAPEVRKLRLHWSQHPDKVKGLYRMGKAQVDVLDKSYVYPDDFRYVMDGSPNGGPYPGLRSPWYDEQCVRKGSPRAVAIDLDINPSGSVTQFFEPNVIRGLQGMFCLPAYRNYELSADRETGRLKEIIEKQDGHLSLWCHLDRNDRPQKSTYSIGIDTSAGTGATPSCISIVDCQTGEKIGEYTNAHVQAHELAPLVTALGWLFEDKDCVPAFLIWERQGPGTTLGMEIMKLGYRRVYFALNEMKPVFQAMKSGDIPGWYPSDDNKRLLLEEYRSALKRHDFINRSESALDECLAFRYSDNGRQVFHPKQINGQDPSRAGVNHGDHVIADALAWKGAAGKARQIVEEEKQELTQGSIMGRRLLRNRTARRAESWT